MKDSIPLKWACRQRRHATPSGQRAWMLIFVALGLVSLVGGYLRTGEESHLLGSIYLFLAAFFTFNDLGWNMLVDRKDREIEELKKKLGS